MTGNLCRYIKRYYGSFTVQMFCSLSFAYSPLLVFVLTSNLTSPTFLFPYWPVICMCGQAVCSKSAVLCPSNSSPFVAASRSAHGLVMTSWKKQRLAADNISFIFSSALPGLHECVQISGERWGCPLFLLRICYLIKLLDWQVMCIFTNLVCKCSVIRGGKTAQTLSLLVWNRRLWDECKKLLERCEMWCLVSSSRIHKQVASKWQVYFPFTTCTVLSVCGLLSRFSLWTTSSSQINLCPTPNNISAKQ